MNFAAGADLHFLGIKILYQFFKAEYIIIFFICLNILHALTLQASVHFISRNTSGANN